jgi:BirA family biotin operon repressor/biotin-[acetyl-CoA-carboxylase] ligase
VTLSWLVREYGDVSSTQDVAEKLALGGAREGTVVLAERQTSGRGRMERRWLSPKGGLYLSIILRPRRVQGVHLLTLVGALAAAEGTRKALGVSSRIRWPNDLVVGGKKLGGVIATASSRGGSLEFVVVGIGINCNFRVEQLGDLSTASATLMELSEGPIDLNSLRAQILEEFARRYEEWGRGEGAKLIMLARSLLSTSGKRVEFKPLRGTVEDGIAEKLEDDGSLVVRRGGRRLRIRAEELEWLREL